MSARPPCAPPIVPVARVFRPGDFLADRLAALWRWLTTSRYTRALEEELDRLRAENRALLNALLANAGYAPLDQPADAKSVNARPRRRSYFQWAKEKELAAARQSATLVEDRSS